MADAIAFELVSPERLLLSADVEMVIVPGAEGDFGVLPGHSPLISSVRPGVISIYAGGAVESRIYVSGGFAEVTTERCTVLADEALPLADADRADVEVRLKTARDDLSDASDDDQRRAAERRIASAQGLLDALDFYAG